MNKPADAKPENPFYNLLLNIVIPSVILMKFSGEDRLGPVNGLLLALAFPLIYGIYDLFDRKKLNLFSILGLVSILLTGGFGLLKLDAEWIAVKEATVPAVIGLAVLLSLKTRFPLVRKMLFNEAIMNVDLVNERLDNKGNQHLFEKLLVQASYLLALSFLLSACLNYGLAKYILVSEPGTPAFNEELGRMTALSYPVIVLPSMVVMILALWMLLHGIKRLTGLPLDAIFRVQEPAKEQTKN